MAAEADEAAASLALQQPTATGTDQLNTAFPGFPAIQQGSVPSGSLDLQTPVRTTFKCNLTPPPVFDRIDVDTNVASWLRLVAKICRLSGYHRRDWSTFCLLKYPYPFSMLQSIKQRLRRVSSRACC